MQNIKQDLNHSASETELAELGAESLASDFDAAVEEGFVSLLHKEIRPLRTCIADTGKTVSSIAETLYQIQDGINNLCCNVTQMKSKVLSSDNAENLFEDETGQEKDQGDEALELVKDGMPVGEPEHLVQRMVHKLDSALRRRDENLKRAIATLEEDNQHLRREVEMYQARERTSGPGNTELEAKIQEVLDNMEQLRQRTHTGLTPRSQMGSGGMREANKELPPIDGKSVTKHKRRSKSRAKSKSRAQDSAKSSSSGTPKERGLGGKCLRGDAAYQADSSTSSDTEAGGRVGKPVGGMQVDVLHTMVNTAQQDNQLLRQDLLVQKEREAQLVKRNMELEAKLIRALTPRGLSSPKGERESPLGGPLPTEAVVPPIVKKPGLSGSPRHDQEVQVAVQPTREDKACMTDLPPPLTIESPTSSSPSKSESPLKVEEKAGIKVRKSRSKVKVKRGATMQEVTETGEVFGRGCGVDGGTPSPSPSRGEKLEEEKPAEEAASKAEDVTVAEETQASEMESTDATDANKKPVDPVSKAPKSKAKAGSLTRQPVAKEVKVEDTKGKKVKEGDKKSEKMATGGGKENTTGEKKETKKVTIEEKKPAAQKEEGKTKAKSKGKLAATGSSVTHTGDNKLTVNLADTRSKVIEGDDFRVTITSNQDMVSCELSDREEEPGSPRKKIVITPKTPDKKVAGEKRKNEEKKEEVVAAKKSTGKIPIRQQYIKQVMYWSHFEAHCCQYILDLEGRAASASNVPRCSPPDGPDTPATGQVNIVNFQIIYVFLSQKPSFEQPPHDYVYELPNGN